MRIGLLVLSVGNFGNKGFYNLQEVGLGKALGRAGHTVEIYKCVHKNQAEKTELIAPGVRLHFIGVRTLGNNSLFLCEKVLDHTLDAMVCFSDIQPMAGRVGRWAAKHRIRFIPYVGVTHSTSRSPIKRILINSLAGLAYAPYRKSGVLVKTNAVKKELESKGITDIQVAPVGIDTDLLCSDYDVPADGLLKELGLPSGMKYILMVGRLESDRNPLDVAAFFEKLHSVDEDYRLLIIGKGSLKEALSGRLAEKGLSGYVTWIERVPNSEMWKYYRIATALVSFSRSEIFGMSILEAMYYELPVFVMHAPGPDDIIVDKESGFLFSSPEEMAPAVAGEGFGEIGRLAHRRVTERFTWGDMVRIIQDRTND